MTPVSVRFFGGAAEAFGGPDTEVHGVHDLAGLVQQLTDRGDARLGEVLAQCSFFIDSEHHRNLNTPVPDGARVDVLPPFAGG